jgi:hypothetical protein
MGNHGGGGAFFAAVVVQFSQCFIPELSCNPLSGSSIFLAFFSFLAAVRLPLSLYHDAKRVIKNIVQERQGAFNPEEVAPVSGILGEIAGYN